jgi:hypothetical protein
MFEDAVTMATVAVKDVKNAWFKDPDGNILSVVNK